MATWINTLSPAKNETNVAVDSDIFIEIESDNELDPRLVDFYINDVKVEPSSRYSIQSNVIDRQKLNVTFFPRRRIKYANKRYGQEDTRYGQTDIYASNFWYGSRYVCRIVVTDVLGSVFEDTFSFTIEEGVFYSFNQNRYYYSTKTQELANYFPEWSKARFDKYSIVQQMMNPAGNFLEEIDNKSDLELANYFLQTSNYNELSLLHKVRLGSDFQFQTVILDDGTNLNVPPDVIATGGITKFYPTAEFSNSLKDFYYKKLPDRIDETKIVLSDNIINAKSPVLEEKIFVNKKLERQGSFCLKIEDGVRFTELDSTGVDLKILAVRISGLSVHKQPQEEDILIIDNDHYFSKKRWSTIDSIQFVNIPKASNIYYTIQYFQENEGFKLDLFRHVSSDDQDKESFWKLNENDYGSILTQYTILKDTAEEIIATIGQKTEVQEYELLDIDNQTHLNLKDIAVDRFSNFIYGIDNDYLYIFDKREEYSSIVKSLPKNSGDIDFALDIFANELARDGVTKSVEIAGIQITGGKQIVKYVFSVIQPDGQEFYITEDGILISNKNEATVFPPRDVLQVTSKAISLELDLLGDYLFCLSTSYADGSQETDAKIVRVKGKSALAKYKMYRLLFDSPVKFITNDYDGHIKVYDENNFLHSLRFAKDNMLIDYGNSEVYFNEGYQEVDINA